jgi:hypothetical protein
MVVYWLVSLATSSWSFQSPVGGVVRHFVEEHSSPLAGDVKGLDLVVGQRPAENREIRHQGQRVVLLEVRASQVEGVRVK